MEKKIIAANKGNDGFVRSLKLMLDASNKADAVAQYLERSVNKLVMLVEKDEPWVRFPRKRAKGFKISGASWAESYFKDLNQFSD